MSTPDPDGLPDKPAAAQSARTIALDRMSPLPLYAQVVHRLQDMIARGDYPSDAFYSETELCTIFDVSRATVRQALQKLASEGVLSRQRGSRTFVNRERFDEAFDPSMNLPEQWARSGRPLSLTLACFEMRPCSAEVAALLRIPKDTPVLHVERMRSDPTGPVSYDYRYVHPNFGDSMQRAEAASQSLLDLLKRRVRLRRGENRIEATLAGEEGERLLQLDPHSPLLVRETVYYTDTDMPVMCGRSIYPAKRIRCGFTVDLGARDAGGVSQFHIDEETADGMAHTLS
ncbi:GntR family transcriptional regulator [Hydrogenophaga sp.]|uniref:GntR family transcriptional regulator n=1 Tax=Hydrogenophaga sp. TaxID=1904254 RepID=UPI002725B899|nr:GntR family transcriptional regulator [Hydrogenophaga sp.]MDO9435653.1 GntR family transcriptional regulator [Hydrogenophaga sp.]